MANMMKTLKKAAIGTVATGAMLTAAASPAAAQWNDRYDRDRDGISAGEIIAGAVVLGGLAAILSSNDNDRYDDRDYRYGDYGYNDNRNNGRYNDRYNDRYNNGYNYNRYGNSRQAVNQCVSAVQQRAGYRNGGARVDQITRIDRNSKGYKIEGRISVNDRYNDRYDNRYDRGRYGYNNNYNRDTGSFSCTVKYGRVDKLKVRGV